MYPATLEGLFNAVKQGTLVDVNEVLNNIKVNINEALHILNYLLSDRLTFIKEKTEKISLLIAAGVKPQFDPNINILLLTNNLSDKNLIQQIINLIKQSEAFNPIYHQAHFDAINGKVCDDSDIALKEDAFGLYPIHYAIAANQDTQQWHKLHNYDLLKPISNGYHKGLNLLYFYLDYGKYELLAQLIPPLTIDQRLKLLLSHPENQIHRNFGTSFAIMYINHLRLEYTARRMKPHLRLSTLTQDFSQNHYLSLLQSTVSNPEDNDYGASVAWLLTSVNLYDDLEQLLLGFSAEQYNALLKSAPLNPNNIHYGTMLIWNIAIHFKQAFLDQLTRNISAEDLFDLLMCAPLHNQNKNYKMSLAWLLLFNSGNTNYLRKCLSLPINQRFTLLMASPQNPNDKDFNVSLGLLLVDRNEYALFKLLIAEFSAEQIFELLKSSPLNSLHASYESNIPKILIQRGRYDLVMELIATLNEEQILSLLSNTHDKSDKSSTDFLSLIIYYAQSNSGYLTNFLERFNSDKFYEIMYEACQNNKNHSIPISLIFTKILTLRLNVLITQPLNIHKEHKQDIAEEIIGLLAYLEKCWPYINANMHFSHIGHEIIGMTLQNACQSDYKLLFCNTFASDPNYIHISKVNSKYALEGFAKYLRIISGDHQQALLLSIEFAQAKAEIENKKTALLPPSISSEQQMTLPTGLTTTSQDETAQLKQQIEALQKENEMLKKAAAEKERPPKIVGNDPKLFGQAAKQQLSKATGGPLPTHENPPRLQ